MLDIITIKNEKTNERIVNEKHKEVYAMSQMRLANVYRETNKMNDCTNLYVSLLKQYNYNWLHYYYGYHCYYFLNQIQVIYLPISLSVSLSSLSFLFFFFVLFFVFVSALF